MYPQKKQRKQDQETQKEQEQEKQLEQVQENHQEQEKNQKQKKVVFTEVIVECGGEKVSMSDKSDIRSEQMDSKIENIGMEEDGASNKMQFIDNSKRKNEKKGTILYAKCLDSHNDI